MSEAARTFVDPDRIERRHPFELPETVIVNPEALAEALAVGRRAFQGVRNIDLAISIACVRLLTVLKEITKRGARFPLSNGRAVAVHPGDVQAAMREIQHHAGGLLIEGVRGEEAIARGLQAVQDEQERRTLLRVKDHRASSGSRMAAIADEVGPRVAAHRASRSVEPRLLAAAKAFLAAAQIADQRAWAEAGNELEAAVCEAEGRKLGEAPFESETEAKA
jgi:hypothetical protein